jgi:hypothetical protein
MGTSDPLRRPDSPPPFLTTFAVRDSRNHPEPTPLTLITFPTCCAHYPGGPSGCRLVIEIARSRAGYFPIRSAFPDLAAGRRPHCCFRGLLKLHAYYGLPDCSPTIRGLCRGVSVSPVTRTHRPPAIESNHQLFEWVLPPLVFSPLGAHTRSPAVQIQVLWYKIVLWSRPLACALFRNQAGKAVKGRFCDSATPR